MYRPAAEHGGRAAADLLAAGDEARPDGLRAQLGLDGRLPRASRSSRAGPGRPARRLDQLDEDAVARARVDERDRPLGALARATCRSARRRRSRAGAASRPGSRPRSRRGGSPRPSLARKRATPVVSSVGSTSSTFDSPTARNAIRTWSTGMSIDDSSSRPSVSRQNPSAASIERRSARRDGPCRGGGSARGRGRRRIVRASRGAYPVATSHDRAESARSSSESALPAATRATAPGARSGRPLGVPAHVTILYPFLAASRARRRPSAASWPRSPREIRAVRGHASRGRPLARRRLPRARTRRAVHRPDRPRRRPLPRAPAVRRRDRRGDPPPHASPRARRAPLDEIRGCRRRRSCRSRPTVDGPRGPGRGPRRPLAAALADPPASDRDQLAVLAPGDPQPVADLADRGVGPDRLDDRRASGCPSPRATVLERVHRRRPRRRRRARPGPAGPARPGAARPSGSIRWSGGVATVVVAEAVDPDDDLVAATRSPAGRGRPPPGSGAAGSRPRSRRASRPSPRSRRGRPRRPPRARWSGSRRSTSRRADRASR